MEEELKLKDDAIRILDGIVMCAWIRRLLAKREWPDPGRGGPLKTCDMPNFKHTYRDVVDWVWGTDKSFPGAPSASLVKNWVHEKVKHMKPFPTVSATVSSEEDSDREDDSEQASGTESDQEGDNREQTDSGR